MKNFIFFALAALSAVSCLEKADGPLPDTETSTATLSEVAEIMSRLPYEEEHLTLISMSRNMKTGMMKNT